VDAQPKGSLSPEQLTRLAHAVRLAHLTPYFLAEVAPRVPWLCAEGREAAVRGVPLARMGGAARSGTPAAWLPNSPARLGKADPASRAVEWELPLALLFQLVAEGGGNEASPNTTLVFGLRWGLELAVAATGRTAPGAVMLALSLRPSDQQHVPSPPSDAKFRWVRLLTSCAGIPGVTSPHPPLKIICLLLQSRSGGGFV
jgi:hypothetical protein